jgi:hypothetical protein
MSYVSNYECKFCKIILQHGYDSNDLMHCQGCHNIWDGNAQCQCYMLDDNNDNNDNNDDKDDDIIENKSGSIENETK